MTELERHISALAQSSMNTLVILIRFQVLLRTMQAEEKLTPSAMPHRLTVEAIVGYDWTSLLSLWVAKAQQESLISRDDAVTLLNGKQIALTYPWLPGVIDGPTAH